jgi:two-component system, chemotaxis family, protein-glutamate methylesterase/glutaminase
MKTDKIIKVLIVDDSHLMCKVLTDVLNSDPHIIVCGIANNGKDAFELAKSLKPDIITMDIHMPIMSGIEATELIMAYVPTPILIISSSTPMPSQGNIFDAIDSGALDFLEKQGVEYYSNKINRNQLIEKVRYLSRIKVITHPKGKSINKVYDKNNTQKTTKIYKPAKLSSSADKVLAVASSTGGTNAIAAILKSLPANLPCAIVIVQHLTAGFDDDFTSWLDSKSTIKVKIAEESEAIKPGTVYLAPTGFQTRIDSHRKFIISAEPSFNGHCPSGDILLSSVAKEYGRNAIGLILTGMGRDGADGIKMIHKVKGKTIAQDKESSIIFGMPQAAIELNAVDYVLPLDKIASKIIEIV